MVVSLTIPEALVEHCKLHDVDPSEYALAVLELKAREVDRKESSRKQDQEPFHSVSIASPDGSHAIECTWTLDEDRQSLVFHLADLFSMRPKDFLTAFVLDQLPGQPKEGDYRIAPEDISITLNGEPRALAESLALFLKDHCTNPIHSIEDYVRVAVESSMSGDRQDIIFHPTPGAALCWRSEIQPARRCAEWL
jgi:hypothetical protein